MMMHEIIKLPGRMNLIKSTNDRIWRHYYCRKDFFNPISFHRNFLVFLVLPFDDFRCVFAWKLQRYLIQTFRTFLSSRNINLPYNDDTIKVQSKQKWHLNHDKNLDNGGFREKIHINICLSVHNTPNATTQFRTFMA